MSGTSTISAPMIFKLLFCSNDAGKLALSYGNKIEWDSRFERLSMVAIAISLRLSRASPIPYYSKDPQADFGPLEAQTSDFLNWLKGRNGSL